MKPPLLLALFIGITIPSPAQKKGKTPAEKPSTPVAMWTTNQHNYHTVIVYLNQLADCMNSQSKVVESKEPYMKDMENYYLHRMRTDKVKADGFRIDPAPVNNVIRDCLDVVPPSTMDAADIAFFKENYQGLRNAFIKLVTIWSDLYAYKNTQGLMMLTAADGKEKYEQLQELTNNYHRIRKKISARNKEIQANLFHYSVAGDPYQEFYTLIYNDLNALQEFSELIDGYEDMLKNKAAISAAFSKIEAEIAPHIRQKPERASGVYEQHSNFYTAVSAYIKATKELLNNAGLSSTEINERILRYRDCLSGLTEKYNQVVRK